MSRRRVRSSAAAVAVLSVVTLTAGHGTASAATHDRAADRAPAHASAAADVSRIEDQLARTLAASLSDAGWRSHIRGAVGAAAVDLESLTARPDTASARRLAPAVADADRRIATAKGLGTDLGPLLRVQLADPTMRAALDAGAAPLVAASVSDEHAATITAYDTAGRAHTLDARTVPKQPVYLVDIDTARTTAAGSEILREALARNGVNAPAAKQSAAGGWWATKVDAVEVNDDQEPWFKGAAEMFSLVTGFGLDGKVRVDTVDMPYLDYDGTVYYPNQILVNWSNYKYNLADVVMMEDDGNTNYLALAQALAAALLTIADQGSYIPLVNAVLAAMPNSWWTDDPDYVESWYTLSQGSTGRLNGASANGWMTVEPYFVQQF